MRADWLTSLERAVEVYRDKLALALATGIPYIAVDAKALERFLLIVEKSEELKEDIQSGEQS